MLRRLIYSFVCGCCEGEFIRLCVDVAKANVFVCVWMLRRRMCSFVCGCCEGECVRLSVNVAKANVFVCVWMLRRFLQRISLSVGFRSAR